MINTEDITFLYEVETLGHSNAGVGPTQRQPGRPHERMPGQPAFAWIEGDATPRQSASPGSYSTEACAQGVGQPHASRADRPGTADAGKQVYNLRSTDFRGSWSLKYRPGERGAMFGEVADAIVCALAEVFAQDEVQSGSVGRDEV